MLRLIMIFLVAAVVNGIAVFLVTTLVRFGRAWHVRANGVWLVSCEYLTPKDEAIDFLIVMHLPIGVWRRASAVRVHFVPRRPDELSKEMRQIIHTRPNKHVDPQYYLDALHHLIETKRFEDVWAFCFNAHNAGFMTAQIGPLPTKD